MGVFHSKPKGPPPPEDPDAPMSQTEVFLLVLKSKKHKPFKRKLYAVAFLGASGTAVSITCSIISIIYGQSRLPSSVCV